MTTITDLENHIVMADLMPPGVGVLPSEVGMLGPHYGVRLPNGKIFGWWMYRTGAESYAKEIWGDNTGYENHGE